MPNGGGHLVPAHQEEWERRSVRRQLYWIYSLEHRAWWRGRYGYTRTIAEAAKWSEKEAIEICRDANAIIGGKPWATEGKDLNEVMVPVMGD